MGLIETIYDAALDEHLWAGAAERIAMAFGATSAVLHLRDTALGNAQFLSTTSNLGPDAMRRYREYYWRHDLWVDLGAKQGMWKVIVSQDLITDREFEQSEFYYDWCRPLETFYLIGTILPISGNEVGVIGIHRPPGGRLFDKAQKMAFGLFLPHLQRALQLRRKLNERSGERQASLEVALRSRTAALVVAPDGRILYANPQAEVVLRSGDSIRAGGGRLTAAERTISDKLRVLIRGAAETAAGRAGSSGGALTVSRPDRLPVTILIAPFRPALNGLGAPQPAAIVFVRDPEAPTPAIAALQDLFGLTHAEATVTNALADGRSTEEIAALLGISLNTARTHLKRVSAKTGTNRQAQLVALVLRSVAPPDSE